MPAAVPAAGEMRSDVGDMPAAMPAAAPAPATLREARAAAALGLVSAATHVGVGRWARDWRGTCAAVAATTSAQQRVRASVGRVGL